MSFQTVTLLLTLIVFVITSLQIDELVQEAIPPREEATLSREEEKSGAKKPQDESTISSIWNYPIIQNRIFTLRTRHIVSTFVFLGLYVNGWR